MTDRYELLAKLLEPELSEQERVEIQSQLAQLDGDQDDSKFQEITTALENFQADFQPGFADRVMAAIAASPGNVVGMTFSEGLQIGFKRLAWASLAAAAALAVFMLIGDGFSLDALLGLPELTADQLSLHLLYQF